MYRTYIILFLLISFSGYSQVSDPFFRQGDFAPPSDSGALTLRLNSTAFFRNNEYFNPLYKGYTLIGIHLTPVLEWKADQHVSFFGGFHVLKYSGQEQVKKIFPVISLQTNLNDRISLMAGTIRGAGEHRLPEALYGTERNLNEVLEDGIQIRYVSPACFSDVWLQWDRFLERYEDNQERLTFGYSGWLTGHIGQGRQEIRFPLYILATHRGGQIDVSHLPIQTLFHYGGGGYVSFSTDHSLIQKFTAGFTAIGFSDVSPTSQLPMKKGYAVFPSVSLSGSGIEWENGFWLAEDFYAPKGDPIFWSWAFDKDQYQQSRRMLVSRLFIGKQISPYLIIGLRGDFFYDIYFKDPDYSYGLFLRFSASQKVWNTGR
ncbi:MAG: hypothetical protein GX419_05195 [Bacteroidales bacterium]|nr:hypothetical protein [Bacteroidales bacterium]